MTTSQAPRPADTAVAQTTDPNGSRWSRIPGFGRPTPSFVHRWAIGLLVANIGIVATGGAVRLTGSGLGCPTWPQCTDNSFVPHGELGIHGVIEFGNRMLTWVLIIIAIATWTAVLRATTSPRRDTLLATVLALGIPFQGVIGGITVLTQLNPWVVALHFLLSMGLVSGATVLVYRTRPNLTPGSTPSLSARYGVVLSWLLYLATWVTVYLGTVVTGSGPHAGDVKAPRNGLAPGAATQLHADAVFVLVGLTIAITVVALVGRLPQARVVLTYVGLLVLQAVIGVVQYVTDLPIALVIAHMIGSALLLVGATWLVLRFRTAEAEPYGGSEKASSAV
ncbi:COX15/CtaA family protein [Gordonia soli]|uniref:Putative cytochrome oxidase assembly protein n=1 Tax=Gordonia soli NBRC 108243 TaxID=1223545 RepID=M0QJM5_9ACTN|nr:COX15/CtaA family protein [Gordonia soli]GAC68758.1 putative cytochrome oxidase assembly protein [Gordonia soli NBRC 108243]